MPAAPDNTIIASLIDHYDDTGTLVPGLLHLNADGSLSFGENTAVKGISWTGIKPATVAGQGTSAGTFHSITAPNGGDSSTATGGAGGSIVETTGDAGASVSGGANGGDKIINLGAGSGTGRRGALQVLNGFGQFIVPNNTNKTFAASNSHNPGFVFKTTTTANEILGSGSGPSAGGAELTFSGLTASYTDDESGAWANTSYSDTSAQGYTQRIRTGMNWFYVQTAAGSTIAQMEVEPNVCQIQPGAGVNGTMTKGYGVSGELIHNGVAYHVVLFKGVNGQIILQDNGNCDTAHAVYGSYTDDALALGKTGVAGTLASGGYFQVNHTNSSVIATGYGSYGQVSIAGSGAVTNAVGAYGSVTTLAGSTAVPTTMVGVQGDPLHNNAVALGQLRGLSSTPTNHSTATVANCYGLYHFLQNDGNGIVTYYAGARIFSPTNTGTGTIPTAHGVRIDNLGSAAVIDAAGLVVLTQSGATHNTEILIGAASLVAGHFSIYNASNGLHANVATQTNVGAVTDGYLSAWRATPTYDGAFTVTRHNFFDLNNPLLTNAAVLTDAAVFRFDAAIGTHKALAANGVVATTMTSLGPTGAATTIQGWLKINVAGTLRYIPCW